MREGLDEAPQWEAIDECRAALDRIQARVEELEEALRFAQGHAKRAWWANAVGEDGTPLGDYPVERFNEGHARLAAALEGGDA